MTRIIPNHIFILLFAILSSTMLFGCGHSATATAQQALDSGTPSSDNPTPTPTPTPTSAASTDATVSNIVISPGSLDQVVQADTTSYTATVARSVSSVDVTVTLTDSNATLDINGSSVASGTSTTVPLAIGSNSISAHVVAEDGSTSQTYSIDITRQGNSVATVSDITLSSGSLDQAVQASQTSYTATVGYFVASVNVTVTLTDSNATFDINGNSATSGASSTVSLAEGANSISVHVVAEDGTTSQTYTVDVSRQALADMAQQAYAKASNAEGGDWFGQSVAIDGDTMVVGASGEDGDPNSTASSPNNNTLYAGAAYVFVRNNGAWTQQAYLKPSNDGSMYFGQSVDISGDSIVVGAYYESGDANSTVSSPNTNALYSGAAYVYTRSNGVWSQQAYLKASNAGSNDYFGYSVAIDGDSIVVGAYAEAGDASSTVSTPNDYANYAGAAYVFTRSNGIWTQQAYLKASNAEASDVFGYSVAISGDTVVVGSSGEAGDASSTANSPNNGANQAGAAYVFTRSNDTWTQQAYLKASNAEGSDGFGRSVAINGDSIVIGATGEAGDASSTVGSPNNNASYAGAAYVYTRSNNVWTQQAYLKASNAEGNDYFGNSVSIGIDSIVVGASAEAGDANSTVSTPNNLGGTNTGAAYVFTRSNGVWTQQVYLKASNAEGGDYFGHSVDIGVDSVAVGAYWESGDPSSTASSPNNNASNSGATYVFY